MLLGRQSVKADYFTANLVGITYDLLKNLIQEKALGLLMMLKWNIRADHFTKPNADVNLVKSIIHAMKMLSLRLNRWKIWLLQSELGRKIKHLIG